ncbi:MAG: hypothetical protein ABIA21_03590 [Candidatus Aenigmatarchaeota archaeon]
MSGKSDDGQPVQNYFVLLTVIYIAALVWMLSVLPVVPETMIAFGPMFIPLILLIGYVAYYMRYREKPALFQESNIVRIIKWVYIVLALIAIIWGLLISAPMSL